MGLFESVILRHERARQIHLAQGLAQVDLDSPAERRKWQVVRLRAKGLLDLIAQRVETEERIRDQADNKGCGQPNRVNQAKRQQEAVQIRGSVQQQRVGE